MRVQNLNLRPCEQSVMNYIMGSLRVLTGFTAGVLLLLLITHTVLGKAIQALFEPESAVDGKTSPRRISRRVCRATRTFLLAIREACRDWDQR